MSSSATVTETLPDITWVQSAARQLAGKAVVTPLLESPAFNAKLGFRLLVKAEPLQRTGSFKFRGAYNRISRLSEAERRRGVVAYSSGNHAQGVACAAQLLGAPAVIVMPSDAPALKLENTRGYGAEVITYDKNATTREALGASIAAERGLSVIPPYDHPHVVAGQGTAATELIEEVGRLDSLYVPCGGAGLLSGCAIAAAHLSPGCRVIGVEPAAGDDATRSFRTKTLQTVHNPDTSADGARTPSLGKITFPLVLAHVHDMTTVDDRELLDAMLYLWERMKIVVEPTGALGAAGLFKGGHDAAGRRVGVVISGGNVDLQAICRLIG